MQPHTGAIITVINYLLPSLKEKPEELVKKVFTISSKKRDITLNKYSEKFHSVEITNVNPNTRELVFAVGRDYACYPTVRYDANLERFRFTNHRYSTLVSEEFIIYKNSSRIIGSYSSDETYCKHSIEGYRSSDRKEVAFTDDVRCNNGNKSLEQKFRIT